MKKSIKLVSLMLAVLIAASLPVVTHAAYDTAQIYGHNVAYEILKNSTNPEGYASLRVTHYGSIPDPVFAGLQVILCKSNGDVIASNNDYNVTLKTHGFTLNVSEGSPGPSVSYTVGHYYYLGVEWYYSSAGTLVMYHGSFD